MIYSLGQEMTTQMDGMTGQKFDFVKSQQIYPLRLANKRNTLPKDAFWKIVKKNRNLARINGKLDSNNTDDDDENLGNVWMSVPHPLDWNFCFGTIPRFRERETHPENTDLT